MSLLSNLLRKQSPHQTDVPRADVSQTGHQIVPIGQLLSNRYLISELLGRGAMGEVYLAEDTVLGGVSVAVKVISQRLPSKQLLDKFAREAQIGAFLGHHNVNIVRVLDFGIHNDEIPFYVMEYVYGTTLADEIEQRPLPLDRCIRLMSQVCAGLQSAHQGVLIDKKLYSVIHRDLKPGNIFITTNSSFGEIAKILDFGIAEFFLPTHKSTEADAMGTLAYASSEQLMGKKLEPSADIYSLGITMFEALTGKLPIQASINTVAAWIDAHAKQPPRTLKAAAPRLDFPQPVEALIQQCLAKKPDKRPQTVQDCLNSLKKISDSIGSSFPVKSQSQDDVLDELFRNVEPSAGTPQPEKPELLGNGIHTQGTGSLGDATAHLPPVTVDIQSSTAQLSQTQQLSAQPITLAQRSPWPQNKPFAEIVFAQSIKAPGLEQTGLWAMLQNAEAQHQAFPLHRIEFAVEFDPHPMLAWVTVLHDRQGKMRCLPCFLDLVNPQRQQLIQNLVQQRNYLFLLFDLKDPTHPAQIRTLNIDGRQQRLLHQSVVRARQTTGKGNVSPAAIAMSKNKLKSQYQALKSKLPQVLAQA